MWNRTPVVGLPKHIYESHAKRSSRQLCSKDLREALLNGLSCINCDSSVFVFRICEKVDTFFLLFIAVEKGCVDIASMLLSFVYAVARILWKAKCATS